MIDTLLPPTMYQSYEIRRPQTDAFWERATCEEFECPNWQHGWRMVFDTTEPGQDRLARWVINHSRRRFTVVPESAGSKVAVFTFPSGQQCFDKHRRIRQRDPLWIVRGGDRRAAVGRRVVHRTGQAWLDHTQEELDKFRQMKMRG